MWRFFLIAGLVFFGSAFSLASYGDYAVHSVWLYEMTVTLCFGLLLLIWGLTVWKLHLLGKKRACTINADRTLTWYSVFASSMVVLGAYGLFFVTSQQYKVYTLCGVFFLFMIVSIVILMKPATTYRQYDRHGETA